MADTNNDSISIEDLFQALGTAPSQEPREEKKKKSSKKSPSSDHSHDMSELDLLTALGVQDPQSALEPRDDRDNRESSQQRDNARKAQQLRSKQWRAEIDELETKKEQAQKKPHSEPRMRTIRTFPSRVQKTSFSSILPKGAARIIQPMSTPAVAEEKAGAEIETGFDGDASNVVQETPDAVAMQQTIEQASSGEDTAQFESVDVVSTQDTGQMQPVHTGFMATNFASSSIRPLNDSFGSFVPRDSQQFAAAAPLQGQPFNPMNMPLPQQYVAGQGAMTGQGDIAGQGPAEPQAPVQAAYIANGNDAGMVQRKPFGGNPLPAFSNASFIQPLEPTMNAFDKPNFAQPVQNFNTPNQSVPFQPLNAVAQADAMPTANEPMQSSLADEKNITDSTAGMQPVQSGVNDLPGQTPFSQIKPMPSAQPSPVQPNYVTPAHMDASATGVVQQAAPSAAFEPQAPQPQMPSANLMNQTGPFTPITPPVQSDVEQSEPILPPAQAQLDWISSAPEPQAEPIKEDEKSSKRSTIIGISLIGMAVICAIIAFLLLSGIIDLSNFSSHQNQNSSSSSAVARQEGPLTDEVVYSYVVRGTDGGTHEATETAYFGNDGKLKESILQIKVDSQDNAQALLDQLNAEFKESVKSSSIGDGEILITLDINRDDLNKDSYTELLSTNMAEFKVVSS